MGMRGHCGVQGSEWVLTWPHPEPSGGLIGGPGQGIRRGGGGCLNLRVSFLSSLSSQEEEGIELGALIDRDRAIESTLRNYLGSQVLD